MSEAYLIEANDPFRSPVEAGLVLRERGGFRFFAAHGLFAAIENKLFRRPAEAERAAAELLAQARQQSERRPGAPEEESGASLVDPLALPPDWHMSPSVLSLAFLPFDR